MMSRIPSVIRGFNASELLAEEGTYADDRDGPRAFGLRMLARRDHLAKTAAALPGEEMDDIPTDLIHLTGGGRSNFGLPPDPPQPDSHDFSGDWSGIVGRIVDASADAAND